VDKNGTAFTLCTVSESGDQYSVELFRRNLMLPTISSDKLNEFNRHYFADHLVVLAVTAQIGCEEMTSIRLSRGTQTYSRAAAN
jgi:hypothetical protein